MSKSPKFWRNVVNFRDEKLRNWPILKYGIGIETQLRNSISELDALKGTIMVKIVPIKYNFRYERRPSNKLEKSNQVCADFEPRFLYVKMCNFL